MRPFLLSRKTRFARAMVCMRGYVLHWFVQIDGGTGGNIEPGYPHGTYEDDSEGVIVLLESRLQVFFDKSLAVELYVQEATGTGVLRFDGSMLRLQFQALPALPELLDFILGLGDHNGHIRLLEEAEALLQFRLSIGSAVAASERSLATASFQCFRTLSKVRTAVALSIEIAIAFARTPRPMK